MGIRRLLRLSTSTKPASRPVSARPAPGPSAGRRSAGHRPAPSRARHPSHRPPKRVVFLARVAPRPRTDKPCLRGHEGSIQAPRPGPPSSSGECLDIEGHLMHTARLVIITLVVIAAWTASGPHETQATQFGPWSVVPGGGTTDVSPAALADGPGRILLFTKGIGDRSVYVNTFERGSWKGATQVPGGFETDVPLTATKCWDGVHVFAKGLDNRIYFNFTSYNGPWSGWQEVPGSGQTDTSLTASCLSQGAEGLHLFAKGLDGAPIENVRFEGSTYQHCLEGMDRLAHCVHSSCPSYRTDSTVTRIPNRYGTGIRGDGRWHAPCHEDAEWAPLADRVYSYGLRRLARLMEPMDRNSRGRHHPCCAYPSRWLSLYKGGERSCALHESSSQLSKMDWSRAGSERWHHRHGVRSGFLQRP